MRKLALALAASAACALSISTAPAVASVETIEAQMTAASAAAIAREDMFEAFGDEPLKPGQYLWRDVPASAGEERVVISISDQLAYLYRGETLVAVATISTGKPRLDASRPARRRRSCGPRRRTDRWQCGVREIPADRGGPPSRPARATGSMTRRSSDGGEPPAPVGADPRAPPPARSPAARIRAPI